LNITADFSPFPWYNSIVTNPQEEQLMRQYNKVYLEITNRCNLRCSFCPGTRRPPRTMSPAEFRLLAEKLRPATRYLYLHLMGEPLLHPELPALLAIAGELNFLVNITTNGTLLPQVGETLLAAPAVRKVSISLHSLEANDSRAFSAYLGSCISFAKRAAAAGKLTGLRLWNLDGSLPGQNDLNAPMLEELHRAFPGEWPPVREGHKIAERIYLEFGERFEWPDLSAGEREGDAFCYGLRDQFGVLCDGTVVPCCLDHEGDLALGNLFTQPLEEILSSPRARAIYESFSGRQAREELCRKCGYARRFIR
jgi:radical SAM protein with 4Fe4S-binding SPASM domain